MSGTKKKMVEAAKPQMTPVSVVPAQQPVPFNPIKGVRIERYAVYLAAPYQVVVGWIESDTNRDIPHYLIINDNTGFVEGSSTRLFEARGICQAYQKELQSQNDMISKEIDLVEKVDEIDGNTDPKYRKRNWKSH